MRLTPEQIAELANNIAHALGLKDDNGVLLSFIPPAPRAVDALYTRLGVALDAKRPSKHAPSIGEMLAILVWSIRIERPSRWPRQPPLRSRSLLCRARASASALSPQSLHFVPLLLARDAKRALAELKELVAQGAYERTKRAERGRVFAELFLLFDLESILGVDLDDDHDLEEALRRVRRALHE